MRRPHLPRRSPVRRALVVYCHPSPTSFTAAVRDRAIATLADHAVDVRVADLYADGFDPLFRADERRTHLDAGAAVDVERYVDDLRWCDTLVFVYPTWWAGQPAMLKGWFDRVLVRGVAWELPEGSNRLRPLLRNVHTIVALTTHGSRKYVNAIEGEGGKRTLSRGVRLLCHPFARTVWCALYNCDRSDEQRRRRHLDRVASRLGGLAR